MPLLSNLPSRIWFKKHLNYSITHCDVPQQGLSLAWSMLTSLNHFGKDCEICFHNLDTIDINI